MRIQTARKFGIVSVFIKRRRLSDFQEIFEPEISWQSGVVGKDMTEAKQLISDMGKAIQFIEEERRLYEN